MDKKEKLLAYINSQNYIPLNSEELAVMLSVPDEDRELLCNILKECENEGSIFVTKKSVTKDDIALTVTSNISFKSI